MYLYLTIIKTTDYYVIWTDNGNEMLDEYENKWYNMIPKLIITHQMYTK